MNFQTVDGKRGWLFLAREWAWKHKFLAVAMILMNILLDFFFNS